MFHCSWRLWSKEMYIFSAFYEEDPYRKSSFETFLSRQNYFQYATQSQRISLWEDKERILGQSEWRKMSWEISSYGLPVPLELIWETNTSFMTYSSWKAQKQFKYSGFKNALIGLSFVSDLLKRKCIFGERKKIELSKVSPENDVSSKITEDCWLLNCWFICRLSVFLLYR